MSRGSAVEAAVADAIADVTAEATRLRAPADTLLARETTALETL